MKPILLMLSVLLAGCSITLSSNTQPTRWKQVLLDGGTSPQCLALLNNSMSCGAFVEGNRSIYQSLKRGREGGMWDPMTLKFIDSMMAEIEADLTKLVNVPECKLRP